MEFLGFIAYTAFIVVVTVVCTTFNFNAEETQKMLAETCSKNSGIESSLVTSDNWSFKCKDGATFTIKR